MHLSQHCEATAMQNRGGKKWPLSTGRSWSMRKRILPRTVRESSSEDVVLERLACVWQTPSFYGPLYHLKFLRRNPFWRNCVWLILEHKPLRPISVWQHLVVIPIRGHGDRKLSIFPVWAHLCQQSNLSSCGDFSSPSLGPSFWLPL